MRPWLLAETNYGVVKNECYDVALLPFGATEPHNLHLPYGTDLFEANVIAETLAGEAWSRGARVVALPTVPYGTETNQRGFPLTMNLNPSTLALVIRDLVDSLVDSGVQKIVLLNSHGGNDFKPVLRELFGKTPAHLFLVNWYAAVSDLQQTLFENPDDHAGEMETSFALAYFGDLVARSDGGGLAADQGAKTPSRFEAVERGWVSLTREWKLLTTNSGAGDPHAATADKGRRLMEVLKERLVPFLVDLAASPLDERFPFEA